MRPPPCVWGCRGDHRFPPFCCCSTQKVPVAGCQHPGFLTSQLAQAVPKQERNRRTSLTHNPRCRREIGEEFWVTARPQPWHLFVAPKPCVWAPPAPHWRFLDPTPGAQLTPKEMSKKALLEGTKSFFAGCCQHSGEDSRLLHPSPKHGVV